MRIKTFSSNNKLNIGIRKPIDLFIIYEKGSKNVKFEEIISQRIKKSFYFKL